MKSRLFLLGFFDVLSVKALNQACDMNSNTIKIVVRNRVGGSDMKKTMLIAASAAFVMASFAMVPVAAQAEAWGKCKACHNFDEKGKVGPGLKGVAGNPAGKADFSKYGDSLKAATWTWTDDNLRVWMCNSKDAVKKLSGDDHAKTKMPPQKICDAAAQDEVLAKLKSL